MKVRPPQGRQFLERTHFSGDACRAQGGGLSEPLSMELKLVLNVDRILDCTANFSANLA